MYIKDNDNDIELLKNVLLSLTCALRETNLSKDIIRINIINE